MTFGEVLLWNELKEEKLFGFDFDRQRCIDEYIVDFYCKDLMLAIEVDGIYHSWEETFEKDDHRQKRLEQLGVNFIRFTEAEIKADMSNILRSLEAAIIEIIKQRPDINLPKKFDRAWLI